MASLEELVRQRAELELQIAELQRQGRQDAINKIRALVSEYGISGQEIMRFVGGHGRPSSGSGVRPAAKYRNPATGETWSGRGLKPRWLTAALSEGKTINDFMIGAPLPTGTPESLREAAGAPYAPPEAPPATPEEALAATEQPAKKEARVVKGKDATKEKEKA